MGKGRDRAASSSIAAAHRRSFPRWRRARTQVFAALVLEQGGTLDLWLPFKGYADLLSPDARASFWSLHDAAARVQWVEQRVEVEDPIVRDEAYLSASHHIVNECQHLFAVWDGRPARSVGSTAAIVAYAKNTAADRRRYSIRMLARFEESDFESVVGGGF